jgi:hypothetical protein
MAVRASKRQSVVPPQRTTFGVRGYLIRDVAESGKTYPHPISVVPSLLRQEVFATGAVRALLPAAHRHLGKISLTVT